ncbi:hypothetical protein [Variovorax soli]|uniref:Uncharacterized protein n=1 Tax=Variovorax soli TaxID=376815 RepID=A0ABU1NH91_9BURK|nr:hypothetical protein [Variovorax soli]MDR6537827.1 hypothetical protein [Variovorax soli]
MPPVVSKLLRAVAAALLVPLLLFEEWGWDPLAAWVARLAALPFWARLETTVRALPPWAALLVFLVPAVMLLPIKMLALLLLGSGHPGSAVLLLVGAKIAGTAIVARLFQLVEPALMRTRLFARWYPPWKLWKDETLGRAYQSAPWRGVRRLKVGARRCWRALRRFGAS